MSEDRSAEQPSEDQRELDDLQRELAEARGQLADLEGLLGDLPRIFESKYEQRLRPLLEQQRLMAEENQLLLDQVHHALGSGEPPGGRPALPAARGDGLPRDGGLANAGEESRPPRPSMAMGQPVAAPGPTPSPQPSATGSPPDPPGAVQPGATLSRPSPPQPASTQRREPEGTGIPGRSSTPPEHLAGEPVITVSHWVLPRWLPHDVSLARLRRGSGLLGLCAGVALLVAAGVLGLHLHSLRTAVRLADAEVRAIDPSRAVVFSAREVSWLDVRDASGKRLFVGELNGERRFPLGAGLKVMAGRPDAVTVQVAGAPPRTLGRIDQVTWLPVHAP